MTINIFFLGAPGVGKSTLAHGLMYWLGKHLHLSTGFVEESAKGLTWKGHTEQLNNQLYVSGLLWESIISVQGKCDVLICDTHILVSDVYSSTLYKEVLNMESLYKTIEPNSICVIVEPPSDLQHNYNNDGREHDYENSMYVWTQIQDIIIPKLSDKTTLNINRNISLEELGDKISTLINSIQQKNYA
jgi:adenylate kinase family enzyme